VEERRALETIALITASPVRVAIVSKLNTEEQKSYARLKSSVEKLLERNVSDGSFAWHIEKLKGAGVIAKMSVEELSRVEDTAFKVDKRSSKESETTEKFPKKVYKDLKIGPYRVEGYHLTKEGSEIKDAVRAAINRLKPPA